jgi:hypothetical protein
MTRQGLRWAILLTAALFSYAQPAASVAADPPLVTLKSLDAWGNLFAGQKATFHFQVAPAVPAGGRAIWNLSSFDGRTLVRGTVPLEAHPDGPFVFNVALELPPVKDGVTLPARLQIGLYFDSQPIAKASCEKQLLVFAADPFVDRLQWLREMKIGLLDPVGTTIALFEKAKIPFHPLKEVPRPDDEFAGLLIIGEGAPLEYLPDLVEQATEFASRGFAVICLSLGEGRFPIPSTLAVAGQFPVTLNFSGPDVIRRLDKRLDADEWAPNGPLASRRLRLVADQDRIFGQISTQPSGWLWMEATFPETHGKLIVCQCNIVERWESSPAPRYLLARMLETLTLPADITATERNERP